MSDFETLNPESPRWEEFVSMLREDTYLEDCDCTHRHALRIMASMGRVDVDKSIAFFKSHGGFCDCEILYNVVEPEIHLAGRPH
jgi:hypothetical protein